MAILASVPLWIVAAFLFVCGCGSMMMALKEAQKPGDLSSRATGLFLATPAWLLCSSLFAVGAVLVGRL